MSQRPAGFPSPAGLLFSHSRGTLCAAAFCFGMRRSYDQPMVCKMESATMEMTKVMST